MNKFFAASNSAQGFKCYYNDCFAHLDKLYIIKGGPGTGKSGIMRRISDFACDCGYDVEKFYCSSDQYSLDGIIICRDEISIGFIDGTSPHSFDVRIAGAVDNIINLGEFWSEDLLVEKRDEIISLTAQKSREYEVAYKYLCSCGNLSAVIRLYMSECLNTDKIKSVAKKLTSNILEGKEYRESIRLIDSVGMRGRVRFDSFEKMARKIYLVGDMFGGGSIMLEQIKECLYEKKRSILLSYDPICSDRINGILDKDMGYAFILSDERAEGISADKDITHVNMKRFVFTDKLSERKCDIKYANALYKKSLTGALDSFVKIEKYHFALEEIYGKAMDFSGVDRVINDYINKI